MEMQNCNFSTGPTFPSQPMQPLEPPKKYPAFLGRRAGLFYTWTCVATQLGATAIVMVLAAICAFLPDDVANVVLLYGSFSTQIVLLICVLIFFAVYKTNPVEAGLRKTQFVPCLIGVLFCFSLQFTTGIPESIFDSFLSLFGYETSSVIEDIPMEGGLLFLALFTIAVLPAIGEEFIFRGIILESTKKLGTAQACIINGLLFSLFHCNPSQTCYTFLMGAGWALVAIRCNSIWPTVIAHFLNNAYSVLMMYAMQYMNFNIEAIPLEVSGLIMLAAFTCTIGGLVYFLSVNKTGNEPRSQRSAPLWKGALGGLIFNGAMWLLTFFMTIFEPLLMS